MLRWLLEGLGGWAIPIVVLWAATAILVVHRLLARRDHRRRVRLVPERIGELELSWRRALNTARTRPWLAAAARAAAIRRTRSLGFARVADALELADSAADGSDLLGPGDRGAERGEEHLRLVAQLAPLIGLAGTVAGYFVTLQTVAQAGLDAGFAAFAAPASIAMKTTLGGLVPSIVGYAAIGLVPIDHGREVERDAVGRAFARLRGVERRTRALASRRPRAHHGSARTLGASEDVA